MKNYEELKDYYKKEFNSIIDSDTLDWMEKVEMLGDLNDEIEERRKIIFDKIHIY